MKKINRAFDNFLRSSGFRGPPEDQVFGLSPNLQPVAVLANEPESLPRYFATYSGAALVGANAVILEMEAVVPVRIRSIVAAGRQGYGMLAGFWINGATSIIAGAAAADLTNTHGQPSNCVVQSGQAAVGSPNYPLTVPATSAGQGSFVPYDLDFLVPAGRFVAVGSSAAIAASQFSVAISWEELSGH